MVSKVVYGFSFKSYDHFKISKFNKNRKIKVDYKRQNSSKNYSIQKASQFSGNLVVFSKKNVIKNNDFRSKNMKNTLSLKMARKSS